MWLPVGLFPLSLFSLAVFFLLFVAGLYLVSVPSLSVCISLVTLTYRLLSRPLKLNVQPWSLGNWLLEVAKRN